MGRVVRFLAVPVCVILLAAASCGPPDPNTTGTAPVRLAFCYGWYPSNWQPEGSRYHPTAGAYSSTDPANVQRQVADLQYAGVQGCLSSWFGSGTPTDQAFPVLLRASDGTNLRSAIYYEPEGYGNPSSAQIETDLETISRYASDANYLHHDGRAVVFAYGDAGDNCSMVDRWRAAPASAYFYIGLKVFPGYASCARQPDAWHQYEGAVRANDVPGQSYNISPGFWRLNEPSPRLARDPAAFAAAVRGMVASGEPWQLVTTFNEWIEGSSVEPSTEFGRTYLDILHANGQ